VSSARSRKPGNTINVRQKPLCDLTEEALAGYFETLNGHQPNALYDLVIGEVEKPLLRAVLNYVEGNQSRAADILGINRGTLRKKLRQHGLLN
jgi:Fis family transcriptional regulator